MNLRVLRVLLTAIAVLLSTEAQAVPPQGVIPGQYIVVLRDDVADPRPIAPFLVARVPSSSIVEGDRRRGSALGMPVTHRQ